jgi:hypothetical protein
MSDIMQKYLFLKKNLSNSSAGRLIVLTDARQAGKTTCGEKKTPV